MIIKERDNIVKRIPTKMGLWVNNYISQALRLLSEAKCKRCIWALGLQVLYNILLYISLDSIRCDLLINWFNKSLFSIQQIQSIF